MKDLVILKRRQALTTSLKVAEYFEKRHDHVLRDVEEQYRDLPEFAEMFHKTTYPDAYGRPQPMYNMNRDGFLLLVMGFTGKTALRFKLALIGTFNSAINNYSVRTAHSLEVDNMHTQVINGEEFLVADTMQEALTSWFGENLGEQMYNTLSKKMPPKKKCVYILQLENNTTKIGVAQDFNQRSNTISNASGMKIINWCHTNFLPQKKAFEIESACHKVFANKRLNGEYFAVTFNDACAELSTYTPIAKYSSTCEVTA